MPVRLFHGDPANAYDPYHINHFAHRVVLLDSEGHTAGSLRRGVPARPLPRGAPLPTPLLAPARPYSHAVVSPRRAISRHVHTTSTLQTQPLAGHPPTLPPFSTLPHPEPYASSCLPHPHLPWPCTPPSCPLAPCRRARTQPKKLQPLGAPPTLPAAPSLHQQVSLYSRLPPAGGPQGHEGNGIPRHTPAPPPAPPPAQRNPGMRCCPRLPYSLLRPQPRSILSACPLPPGADSLAYGTSRAATRQPHPSCPLPLDFRHPYATCARPTPVHDARPCAPDGQYQYQRVPLVVRLVSTLSGAGPM